MAMALTAVAVLYAVPFGKRTYTAWLAEAESVRVGDDVRLAGISVGSVRSLQLHPDHVVMTFTADSSVFVGRETSLDIRMLTIVGGHYVALFPAGTQPLGSQHIPADRVRLPYNLSQAFQDATAPLAAIDGGGLRKNLEAIADSIQAAPDGVRKMLDGVQQFAGALDRQRQDVSKAISIADEYLGSVDQARGELGRLVQKIDLLETTLSDKRSEVRTAVEQLDRVVGRLTALQPSWQSTLRPMAAEIAASIPELRTLGEQLQPLIDSVRQLGDTLGRLVPEPGQVRVDQSKATVDAASSLKPDAALQFCVPVAGRSC